MLKQKLCDVNAFECDVNVLESIILVWCECVWDVNAFELGVMWMRLSVMLMRLRCECVWVGCDVNAVRGFYSRCVTTFTENACGKIDSNILLKHIHIFTETFTENACGKIDSNILLKHIHIFTETHIHGKRISLLMISHKQGTRVRADDRQLPYTYRVKQRHI